MTIQTIRHDGWLFRLAYIWRRNEEKPTGQVNGCDVIWRAAGNGLFFLSLFFLSFVGIVCLFVAGFCVAIPGLGAYLLYLAASYVITWFEFMSAYTSPLAGEVLFRSKSCTSNHN